MYVRAPSEYRMTRRSRQLNRDWLLSQKNVTSEKRNLLMPIFSSSEMEAARELIESARNNGEEGVRVITEREVLELEPNMDVGGERSESSTLFVQCQLKLEVSLSCLASQKI